MSIQKWNKIEEKINKNAIHKCIIQQVVASWNKNEKHSIGVSDKNGEKIKIKRG